MPDFIFDSNGIPRCQALVDKNLCNGFMILTPDNHFLVCEHGHGRLFPVNGDRATLIRKAYQNRDNPSEADLERKWKQGLPIAVKVATVTRAVYSHEKNANVKKQVAIYKIGDKLYEAEYPATQTTKPSSNEAVACLVNALGSRAAKLFVEALISEEQVVKLQRKISDSKPCT